MPILAAAATILDMLEADEPALVAELHEKASYLRTQLTRRGFDLGNSETHVMPAMVRGEQRVLLMHRALYERGLYLTPLAYPAVRRGEERLRLNVTRGHTYEELDRLVDALAECRAALDGVGSNSVL